MHHQTQLFVIEPDPQRQQSLSTILSFLGEQFVMLDESNLTKCLSEACQKSAAVLLNANDRDDLKIVKQFPHLPFVVFTQSVLNEDEAANIVGQLAEPISYDGLTQVLHRCQAYHRQKPSNNDVIANSTKLFRSLIGKSKAMLNVRFLIEQVARTDANVLVLGESGTGKEVVARNIHYLSPRRDAPFVPVNCGAIPGDLLESELFGHEKGAFTGAISTRKGRFELAQGGTLFLDEIGDMPMQMQVKLLRVLQERIFERVGGVKQIKADVRIIAATHRDLETMIQENTFREDLYYRLNVFPIDTPSLKQRPEDVPLLLQELISRYQNEVQASIRFTQSAMASLMEHSWPGNVREMSNLIERLLILYPNKIIDSADLPIKYQHLQADEYIADFPEEVLERDALNSMFNDFDDDEDLEPEDIVKEFEQEFASAEHKGNGSMRPSIPEEGVNLKEYLAELEVDLMRQALTQHDWVVARAAEVLGMRRTTLVEKMKKYQLQRD